MPIPHCCLSPTPPHVVRWRGELEVQKVNKDHRLRWKRFTGTSKEIRKWPITATMLMTEGTRKWPIIHTECFASPGETFSLEETPFPFGNDIRWYSITSCPSCVYSWIQQKLTLSWPEPGHGSTSTGEFFSSAINSHCCYH